MAEVDNAVMCPQGGTHAWIYLGKETQWYQCTKCGAGVSKARLKAETDMDTNPQMAALKAEVARLRALVPGGTPNA